ncbi:ATP-dependent DNA helicase [Trichonephila clavata]|uniref:ATP-dependent DNA helicase n=1 Tax=Trichonephila clavata TaxID=2740835 RepID=A0A8X6J1M2_TRICU|nr:ATP-dependent DNA helicase [Trichonephila clavata]
MPNRLDEVTTYQQGRYISSSNPVWCMLNFPIHQKYPTVVHLAVHLKGGQRVYYEPRQPTAHLTDTTPKTTLTAIFYLFKTNSLAKTLLHPEVYPNIQQNFKDQNWLSHRAVLASRNDVVEKLNVTIQKQLPLQEYACKSIDCIFNDDEAVLYPLEFLNSIQTPDFQAHDLILRVGAPIMLI